MPKDLVPVGNVIRMWEGSLEHDSFLMNPSTVVLVKATVSYLKELRRVHEQRKNIEKS